MPEVVFRARTSSGYENDPGGSVSSPGGLVPGERVGPVPQAAIEDGDQPPVLGNRSIKMMHDPTLAGIKDPERRRARLEDSRLNLWMQILEKQDQVMVIEHEIKEMKR